MTTTIVSLQTYGVVIALLSIMMVMGLTCLLLHYIDRIDSLLGRRGSSVLSSLVSVFVAVIAVRFILTGVQYYYPVT